MYKQSIDVPLANLAAKLPRFLEPLMVMISRVISPLTLLVLTILALLTSFIRTAPDLRFVALATLVLLPLAEIIKRITRRQRPDTLFAKNMRFKTYSFPSGHAYVSALVLTAPLLWFAGMGFFGVLAAFVMGFLIFIVGISRVYLGAHFPSDVLVGWLLGILLQIAIWKGVGV